MEGWDWPNQRGGLPSISDVGCCATAVAWACRRRAAAEPVAAQLAAKGLPANLPKESQALQISQLSTLLEVVQDPDVHVPEGELALRP